MKFEATPLKDAWVISLEPHGDDRGFFARAFCRREFEEHGINPSVLQCNTSFSRDTGTLRGLHYQVLPSTESKLMRCIRGSIYDVIVDMRQESPTYLQHFGITLSAENRQMIYVPQQFAHGFLTLEEDSEVFYMVGAYYAPEYERGLRYDDPALNIQWPAPIHVTSEKDRSWPLLDGKPL